MPTARLQNKIIYGLRTDVAQNAHYLSDGEILYPVGNAIAIHEFSLERQKLIELPSKQVNIIAVTPNKKFVALCETGEKATISIYNLASLKRKKTLGIPGETTGATKYTCISFSFDSKCLAAVIDDPDQTMLFYNWEKGKVESSMKLGSPQNTASKVEFVACNPGEVGVVAVAGSRFFKFLNASETIWRPYGFSKADNLIITSLAWLNSEKLLAGTIDGRILFFENGELKNIFKMWESNVIDLKTSTQRGTQALNLKSEGSWEHKVCCLVVFPKGLVFSQKNGAVAVFEKTGPTTYAERNIFAVPGFESVPDNDERYEIRAISVNPSNDKMVVTTGWSQLFYADLWNPGEGFSSKLKVLGYSLHYGRIGGLSTCPWKPIFMTYGAQDRTVRFWNSRNMSLLFAKHYQFQNISCVSLHPTGLFCLISFSENLQLETILMDDLKTSKTFPIKSCKIAGFSNGGHLFAAVSANVVLIYTTTDFQRRFILKGHSRDVSGISWSHTDTKLYSVGLEGGIYEWDMASGTRTAEVILKDVDLRDLAVAHDSSYCIASDGFIREVKESSILHEFHVENKDLKLVKMGRRKLSMFVTCSDGVILSLKMPLQEESVHFADFHLHSTDITQMALTNDEQGLITTGEDGTLCIWKIMYSAEQKMFVDQELLHVKEVLIGRKNLKEMIRKIGELTMRIKELETECVFKMQQVDNEHEDKMKETHETYHEIVKTLKERIEELEEIRARESQKASDEMTETKADHERVVRDLEIGYEQKLIVEYEKYKDFEKKHGEVCRDYETKLKDSEKSKIDELEETVSGYEARLYKKSSQLKGRNDELLHQAQMQEKLVNLMEDDTDREILEIRTEHAEILREEKQTVLKLQGEIGALKNRYNTSQKEVNKVKSENANLKKKIEKLQKTIEILDGAQFELKQELEKRDKSIQQYEAETIQLKRNIEELEKHKLVMGYKIRELQTQIEPQDMLIQKLQKKESELQLEAKMLHANRESLKVQMTKLQEKLNAVQKENHIEIQKHREAQLALQTMRMDVVDAARFIHNAQVLKKSIIDLHHRYCEDKEFEKHLKLKSDVYSEFQRQRDHLEGAVAAMQKKLKNNERIHTSQDRKKSKEAMEDNMTLIAEIKFLEKELGRAKTRITELDKVLASRDA